MGFTGSKTTNVFSNIQSAIMTKTYAHACVKLKSHNNFSAGVEGTGQTISTALLKLNGQDRFQAREANYFNKVVPFEGHLNGPSDGIYAYNFALKPEEHQPSGTCNFSRIDNAQLNLTFPSGNEASKVSVYAVNYNVLRIMSRMGGLAYSN